MSSLNALLEHQHVHEFVILKATRNFAAVLCTYKGARARRIKIDACNPPPTRATTTGPGPQLTFPSNRVALL